MASARLAEDRDLLAETLIGQARMERMVTGTLRAELLDEVEANLEGQRPGIVASWIWECGHQALARGESAASFLERLEQMAEQSPSNDLIAIATQRLGETQAAFEAGEELRHGALPSTLDPG